jgi:hypothetical protein
MVYSQEIAMLISRDTAKNLLSGPELALFDDARRDHIKALDRRQAQARLERAQRLREKYLGAQQRDDADPAVARKALVFEELLARFQRRIEHIDVVVQKAREIADRAIGSPPPPPRKPRRTGTPGLRMNVPRSGPGQEPRIRRETENLRKARKLTADPLHALPKPPPPHRRSRPHKP